MNSFSVFFLMLSKSVLFLLYKNVVTIRENNKTKEGNAYLITFNNCCSFLYSIINYT